MTLTVDERRNLEKRAADLDEATRQWDYDPNSLTHTADLNRRIDAALTVGQTGA